MTRHLSFADPPPVGDASGCVVSPAVAAEAGHDGAPGWEPFEGLVTGERDLVADALEAEDEHMVVAEDTRQRSSVSRP